MDSHILAGYELKESIGTGGFGTVYRAYEPSVARDVAVKMILPEYANKTEFRQRFTSEAQLVAKLEHPHIVPLYSFWQDEKGAFLVMRYIQGGSLRDILKRQGALSLAQTQRVVGHIAEALSVAHDAGVVHRDLKPANVLLDQRGNAYLTDFGIAKQLDRRVAITESNALIGTMAYLSPEQLQGAEASPQSDIYALGIMLYEMLTGEHPFGSVPIGTLITHHLSTLVPSVNKQRPDLPSTIDTVIAKATAKEPDLRYLHVTAMHQELQQITTIDETTAKLSQPLSARTGSTSVNQTHTITPIHAKTPTTPEGRNRVAMLQNVRKFWVEGVLENSLYQATLIELGLKSNSDAVDNPWDTLLRTGNSEKNLSPDTRILDVFEQMNGKLLILGDPGSGKTTSLLELARDLLHRADYDTEYPIPVVFNLASWSEKQSPIIEWLIEELNSKYQVPRKVASEWVEHDALLLLLDGLDEVAEEVRDACVSAINAYRSEHGFVDVVVCSRIKDYDALSTRLKLNGAIVVQPLDDEQIHRYLAGLGSDVAVVRELINRDEQLHELARSPLMLSIMILAYRGQSASNVPDFDDVETQRQHLFEVYVDRMFERRLGEISYTKHKTRHYLKWLAQQMLAEAHSVFQIENMQPSWLDDLQRKRYLRSFSWIDNIVRISFVFPALIMLGLLTQIPFGLALIMPMIGGMVASWVTARGLDETLLGTIIVSLSVGMMMFILVGIGYGLSWGLISGLSMLIFGASIQKVAITQHQSIGTLDPSHIINVEVLRFSPSAVRPSIGVWGFVGGCALAIGGGLAFAENQRLLLPSIVAIFSGGIVFSIVGLFTSGLTSPRVEMHTRPNQGIRNSFKNSVATVLITVTTFIIFGIISLIPLSSISAGIATTLLFSFAIGHVFSMAYGGYPVICHTILRRILQSDGMLPKNMEDFLDHVTSLILMRKVGGGYIFIHRYLLEYFATLEEVDNAN